MTNLERRLRKLEAVLTDHTGLVPHTKSWLDYWLATYERLDDGQEDATGINPADRLSRCCRPSRRDPSGRIAADNEKRYQAALN
jgi:hypothetical protein